MNADNARAALQLRSLVKSSGELELSLVSVPVPDPGPDEVVLRVEAAPINPSDLGLLLGPADMRTAKLTGTPERPVLTAVIPAPALQAIKARIGVSMPVGNEGAGVVVATGSSDAARALQGKAVAALGGAMYSEFRCVPVVQCLVLPAGATPADGASAFVNPLTALGMIETMRREGHTALVHTAAASNLGQMLNRLCRQEEIGLVNIVRRADQEALLHRLGARHICNSGAASFLADLTEAIAATGATLGFDALGGGKVAGQILGCMEAAASRSITEYSRYGSTVHKQVYIYGGLDPGPTEFTRNFGMSWGMGGWLLFPFLQKLGPQAMQALKARVAAELQTTFASPYAGEISLADALRPDVIARYGARATGAKYLINPSRA